MLLGAASLELGLCHAPGRQFHRHGLEPGLDLEQMTQFVTIKQGDQGVAIAPQGHQAFARQLVQGITQGRARDAQTPTQSRLQQTLPRGQLTVDDQPLEQVVGFIGQGRRLDTAAVRRSLTRASVGG